MFEDLIEWDDLEYSEHRLRVEVMSLKRREDVEGLFRLYGLLARVLAMRGEYVKVQDALNDAEFLLVEHKWRGTEMEIWCHYDRALVFQQMGRPAFALSNLKQAEKLLGQDGNEELRSAIAQAREKVTA